ncbi:MAG TPA: cytochrome P450 [Pseudonocardiaceae bacterium]|nr:cytochrome P450 [Pseudonocardiaceae bacterium]
MTSIGVEVTIDQLTEDPHPVLAQLRAQEPVSWLPALNAWLVTSYPLVDQVLRDPGTFTVDDPRFSTARVVGPSMLSTDGPAHAHHRDPFAPAFRPAAVRTGFAASIHAHTEELLDGLRPRGTAELRREFAGPLAVAVLADVLGLAGVQADTVLAWYETISAAVSGISAGRPIPQAATEAFGALRAAIEASLASPSLIADVATSLSVEATVSNAAVLMFGGIDTVEGMITNAALHLLTHPDQQPTDADSLANAIEESLRLEPAAALLDRYATRDVELADARIRAGDLVCVSLAGAHRDPAVFTEPDRFDIARGNARQHLAFARGPHFCLAAELARLEANTALAALTALPDLRLVRPVTPRGLVFRKPPELLVRWEVD